MKKNLIFMIAMLLVVLFLFFLRVTGLTIHIIISLLGIAIMVPFSIKTKNDWNKPAFEIIMRIIYLVAIITGGILIKFHTLPISIIHKISAILFILLLLVLYIPKCRK